MSVATFIIGDTRDVTARMPDGSVDLVLTSPPFLALRSYLPTDHPDKHREIGSEATPAEFLQVLLEMTAEWRRVLAPHGSICVELGDTYSGSGGAGGDYNALGMRADQPLFRQSRNGRSAGAWPLDKSLCGIPHLYHLSLAYGRNLLTGELSPAGQWRVRNVVAWCRPNPPVGALGDKFRPATSYMTVATVAGDRYFDLDAVREQFKHPEANERNKARGGPTYGLKGPNFDRGDLGAGNFGSSTAGAPPLDWWEIATHPYPGSHYATFPPDLCTRPIKAMCPERVCTSCGEPSRRIVGEPEYVAARQAFTDDTAPGRGFRDAGEVRGLSGTKAPAYKVQDTVGWTDCGHNTWRNGITFDPFAGSGTTLAVATGHGRDAIGIDIDERNADLARERVGMFLTVEHFTPEAVA